MASPPVNRKDSLEPPPPTSPRQSRKDLGKAEQAPALPSTSSGRRHSLPSGHEPVVREASSVGVSHFSVSSLLGYHGVRSKESNEVLGDQKLKGEKARSLLRMLLRTQKTSEESVSNPAIDVHGLVPCGDVAGLLAITVKQCQDFTSKFNVTRDIYLLIRINIDKIMKCTNPQVYKASMKNKKTSVYFGDVRYFSLKVPKQKGDPRNRIALELVGFEGPMDFPRLFGRVTMHLYEVIKKQAFTETCAMRIRNMVFCTVDVEFMFCYGCLGYGYSHQLKLPGADPAKAVAYSMFLRVPPPENRKDHARNIVKPQLMDYPAFLSPDLNVKVGNQKIEKPPEISDYYKSLQKALQQPAQERLVKMKKEYRSLKTWREKAEYLDQLIVKRGPKTKPKKASRFRDFVGRIHGPHQRIIPASASQSKATKEEVKKKEPEIKEPENVPGDELKPPLEVPTVLTSSEAEPEEPEKPTIQEPRVSAENMCIVPAVMVSSVTSQGPPSVNVEKDLEGEVLQERIDQEPEILQPVLPELRPELLDTYDAESPSAGPENHLLDKNLFEAPSVPLSPEYLQESFPWLEGPVSTSAEFPEPEPPVAELEEQWPWKEAKVEVFTANRFEPFLRRVCRVPPPPFKKGKDDFSELEQIVPSDDNKEQEDQDPPHGMPLTKANEVLDPRPIKSSEQLSILRLIERKMDLEEGEQKAAMQDQMKKPLETSLELYQKPMGSKQAAEIMQVQVYFRRSLEAFFVDKLAKIVALKSLLNKNIDNLVTEGFSEVEKTLAFKDQSLADNKQECFLNFRNKFTESDIGKLKFVICQNLQAHLIETLCEKGIIPAMELPEKDLKDSLSPSSSVFGKNNILSEERILQSEILRIKLPSDSQSRGISTTENTKEIKTIAKNSDSSKRKIEDDRMSALSFQNHDGSVEGTNADLRGKHSNQSLEIIKIRLPVSIEPDSIKQRLYVHDSLLEKQLKAELTSLKTFLSKGLQDHLKDKLSEAGLNVEYLNKNWKLLFPESRDPREGQVFFNEGLAGQTPIFRESIQNLFEDLSESEIDNFKSVWNPRIQEQLSERLSEIRLIIEKELKLILESLIPVVAEETPTKEAKELDLSREAERGHLGSPLTQSLHDKFSEEELQNVKSLFHTLVTEGQTDKLTESEVSGLSSVLRKSFENLPVQNSFETGISKDIEIKDECHSISLPHTAEELRFGTLVAPERGKRPSKESLLTAAKNFEFPVDTIFETETMNKETQTTLSPKKAKRPRKEGHRLPGYPANLIMADTKTGLQIEMGLKSNAQEEHGKRMPEPPSSFLSAHDIGIQTEGKTFFSKAPNFLSKPSFPVNPQTFLSLHSESEEEGKAAVMCHQRPRARKPDKKKEDMTFSPQQAVLNPQAKKERMGAVRASKEVFRERGRKQGEMAAPKQIVIESKKAAVPFASRESLKQKLEKKKESDLKQKKTPSKTALLSEPQLQNVPKLLTEKPSTTKYPISGRIKGNPLNLAGTEDLDVDAYKHLEKAVERALMDLERSPEGTSSKGRPYTAPGAPIMSKDAHRSFPSSFETPRNQAGSISELLNNQEQIFTMAPEQLETVLRILHKILRQNTPPK